MTRAPRLSGSLPLRVEPAGDSRLDPLIEWLRAEPREVEARLTLHGALLFRGFEVSGPEAFEAVARAIAPALQRDYLGTSPRNAVTDYVFNASELPDYFPIPQHCEMSFCARPPSRVFFCCLVEPARGSGETPLCDFRAVWRDLEPDVRRRFAARGLRIIRNYSGPGADDSQDPMRLKRWDEMFGTTDRASVEARCRAEGFEATWLPGDGLRLVSTQPVYRDHPATGERVWYNHLTTFHRSSAEAEYRRIAAYRPSERHAGLLKIAQALDARVRALPAGEQSMHCTALDGSEFDDADLEHLRDVVWKHLVVTPWQRGDILAIDNASVSHGRLPYEGPRRVVVAWA
jgi:alpha-ketoglutarate-dependent taurine dioxygenase